MTQKKLQCLLEDARNYLKFEKVKDIDIATVFSPEEIKKFDGTKFKLIETGIDHGSLTLINGKNKYELTTLRKDIITDGRHAEIEKINNWREDSNRGISQLTLFI